MAEKLTPAALVIRVPERSWTGAAPSTSASWFAVLQFDEARKALVVTATGIWAWTSTSSNGRVRVHELRPPEVVGALPVLELDPAGLTSELESAATILQTSPVELVAALPTAALFIAACESRSDYWIDRALLWMDTPYWPTLPVDAMNSVIDDPKVSQSIRHRTRKLLSTPSAASR